MTLPPINKQHVSAVMLAIAALMLVDCLYQAGMHVRWRCWMPDASALTVSTQPASSQPASSQPASSEPASTQPAPWQPASSQPASTQPASSQAASTQPSTTQSSPARGSTSLPAVALSAAIKKRNIMAEPKPKGHGLKLTGVLGTTALFGTREGQVVGIEEGQSGPGGVKVTGIDGYVVTIECEGKPETMRLFADGPEGGGPGGGPPAGPPAGPVGR